MFGSVYNHYVRYKLMKDWANAEEVIVYDDHQGLTEEDLINHYKELARIFREEDKRAKDKNYKPRVIGRIEIKKIKVDIPIIRGTSQEDLKWGAGYFIGSAPLGHRGNAALAGHRSYTFGKHFNRLNEMAKGDEITIKTKEDIYRYRVYDKRIVDPYDFSVLAPQGEEKILTLITCEPIYIATHRLIIHAKLME